MWIYLGILAFISWMAMVVRPSVSVKRKRVFVVLSFVLLIGVAAARDSSVGVDTLQYCTYYPVIGAMDWFQLTELRYEPGFFLFCKVLYCVSSDPQLLIMASSCVIFSAVGLFIYRYSSDAYLSVVLFICLQGYAMAMNVMRQYLATSIVLFALPFLFRGQKLRFAVAVALAAQFHSAAWVYLLLILFAEWRLRPRSFTVMLVASAVGYLGAGTLSTFVIENSGNVYYGSYLENIGSGAGILASTCNLLFYTAMSVAVACFSKWRAISVEERRQYNVLGNSSLVPMPICAMSLVANTYVRFMHLFSVFVVVSLPTVLNNASSARAPAKWLKGILLVLSLTYFCITSTLRPEWYGVFNYSFFFAV